MGKTAGEAGWHISRYNLSAPLPGGGRTAVVNLYRGSCVELSMPEMYLLSVAEELDEDHPILKSFAKRGLIVRFDERAVLEACGRASSVRAPSVGMTICPTMSCNFDCPYCFERHRCGQMSSQVQQDVISLAQRMLEASGAKELSVTWFGGEPLLQPGIIQNMSERLISLCEKRSVKYSAMIVSNGYLLNPEIVKILERGRVEDMQITLDGIGEAHNATRHLAGGGASYEKIMSSLRTLKLPFRVHVRHNIHAGNLSEYEKLEELIRRTARESGNELSCYPASVDGSNPGKGWYGPERNACEDDLSGIFLRKETGGSRHSGHDRGHYCMAGNLLNVCVDELGNLYKCWDDVADPDRSFAKASEWDILNPFDTASRVDILTAYMNSSLPISEEKCRECRWLPLCSGGCPHRRLMDGTGNCLPFKDRPEDYVLARYQAYLRSHSAGSLEQGESNP